jgi:hypothetical protein
MKVFTPSSNKPPPRWTGDQALALGQRRTETLFANKLPGFSRLNLIIK